MLAAPSASLPPGRSALARAEDDRLLRGQGRYVHDVHVPGLWHAVLVRSVYASARLNGVDTSAAAACEGVRSVLTGADLRGLTLPAPNPLLPLNAGADFPAMALDRLDYVGQPLALVVADTREQARMAAEQVFPDCDPESAVTDAAAAAAAHEPLARAVHGQSVPDASLADCLKVEVQHAQPRVVAL